MSNWLLEEYLMRYDALRSSEDVPAEILDDLLSIDAAISKLRLSPEQLSLLNDYKAGLSISNIASKYHVSRHAVLYGLEKIIKGVAAILGDDFSDESFVNYMISKYNLTTEQITIMQLYMKDRFKHKLRGNKK